jgi:hypothetical protein
LINSKKEQYIYKILKNKKQINYEEKTPNQQEQKKIVFDKKQKQLTKVYGDALCGESRENLSL